MRLEKAAIGGDQWWIVFRNREERAYLDQIVIRTVAGQVPLLHQVCVGLPLCISHCINELLSNLVELFEFLAERVVRVDGAAEDVERRAAG